MDMRRLITALLLVPVLACYARAEEEAGERDEFDDDAVWEELEKRVSVDFKETPLADAIAFFGKESKVNLVLHREVREKLGKSPVTMKLANVPIVQAVRALAAAEGLECAAMDGAILLLRFPRADEGEPAGTLSVKLGSLKLELNIKQGDLPPEARRRIVERALEQMEFEAEMRHAKMEKLRRGMEEWQDKNGKKEWRGRPHQKEGDPGEARKPEQF